MAKDENKQDLFADERIIVTVEGTVASEIGLFTLKRAVSATNARKILKLMLKMPKKQ